MDDRKLPRAGLVLGRFTAPSVVVAVGLQWTFALTTIPINLSALLIAFLVDERDHDPQPQLRLFSAIASLVASQNLIRADSLVVTQNPKSEPVIS